MVLKKGLDHEKAQENNVVRKGTYLASEKLATHGDLKDPVTSLEKKCHSVATFEPAKRRWKKKKKKERICLDRSCARSERAEMPYSSSHNKLTKTRPNAGSKRRGEACKRKVKAGRNAVAQKEKFLLTLISSFIVNLHHHPQLVDKHLTPLQLPGLHHQGLAPTNTLIGDNARAIPLAGALAKGLVEMERPRATRWLDSNEEKAHARSSSSWISTNQPMAVKWIWLDTRAMHWLSKGLLYSNAKLHKAGNRACTWCATEKQTVTHTFGSCPKVAHLVSIPWATGRVKSV